MKKFLLLLFLIFGCTLWCNSQTFNAAKQEVQKVTYQEFNDVVYGKLNTITYIHFSAYVTMERIIDPIYRTKYNIVIVNHSLYSGKPSQIYISGIRVFVNNQLISGAYPNGFWSLIPYNEETTVYWYKTNATNLNFSLTWDNIQHY